MIWLGGALAAGILALAIYLTPGSAIEQVFAEEVVYFRIGAGAPGSTLYDLAGQVAGAISNPPGSRQCEVDGPCGVEGLVALAQTTVDPVESLQSLEVGALESAIVSADTADAASHGTGAFKKSGPMEDLRAIANVGQLVLHVLVPKEARFQDLAALSGKRIAVGIRDSDNAVTARFLLRSAGINERKTKLVTGDPEAAAQDMLADKVDALALVARLPSADVAALMHTGNYRLLGAQISDDNKSAYVISDWIAHQQYPGAEATPTLSLPAVLVVRASLSSELADGLAKALWHSAAKSEDARAAGKIRLDVDRMSVPLHPGAEAAFTELRRAGDEPAQDPQPTTN
ncbi:MAG: TAXI family TRAP transporter solute-binding subunit [Dongiaceae bacterium]